MWNTAVRHLPAYLYSVITRARRNRGNNGRDERSSVSKRVSVGLQFRANRRVSPARAFVVKSRNEEISTTSSVNGNAIEPAALFRPRHQR